MRVLILRGVTLKGGATTQAGDIVEVSDAMASELIRAGKAEKAKQKAIKKTKKDD